MFEALRELRIRNPIDLFRSVRNFVVTIWNPGRSDIQQGIQTLVFRQLQEATQEDLLALEKSQPELLALFREGYDPDISPERLEAFPDGTLGNVYARFIRQNGITPLKTLLAMGEPKTLLAYQAKRAYKLHDLMHVVLDTDATVLGEVPIVAFSLGQARRAAARAPAMALAVLVMNIGLRRPQEMREAVRRAARWLDIGERARWHVTFRVEDYLERPVGEVREAMLGGLVRQAA